MTGKHSMKSVAEASAEILLAFEPLGAERLSLLCALGRFTSEPCFARHDLPGFDNSAMDGYALLAAATSGARPDSPARLSVRGESRAGGETPQPLVAHSAQRIFTGAALPAGADAVELQENVKREGDEVLFERPLTAHDNVRRRGSDVKQGEQLLGPHAELLAGEIALLASQEYGAVNVFRRPRVAVLCTGDELREIGEPPRPGSIINTNGYAISAQVLQAGAEPWLLPVARDRREDVTRAVREALAADVVVICGGVSVGDYDVVRESLADAGVSPSFWKINMKPGKPLSFGMLGHKPVLGLPGNPVSAWVTFELFVRPGLRKMLGDPAPLRPRLRVRMSSALSRKPGRSEFVRARLFRDHRGIVAEPLRRQGSGSLPSMVAVDALLELAPECAQIEAGAGVDALLLRPLPG